MRIEVICTGDEVLTGKVVNTNFSTISQKLGDAGLSVAWETTVGDERESLRLAFSLAAGRADAVIVNGGLGPTVDDLSQEMAASAAGVPLELNEAWLARMETFFRLRSRVMPANNRKQAMLPAGAEVLDNPIGTACGFALDIGKARFLFTPGVPRELRRMLDEQIIPRLLQRQGSATLIRLKRFHSFGIGESRADQLLAGVEALAGDGSVKLGFRAHYPQLETKLTVTGADEAQIRSRLGPVEAEVRRRLGHFILCEDDQTLEEHLLEMLESRQATLALAETVTGGQIAARLANRPAARRILCRAVVALEPAHLAAATGLDAKAVPGAADWPDAAVAAESLRTLAGSSHALAVLVRMDEGPDRIDFGGDIAIGMATPEGRFSRTARLVGGRDWLRLGAMEMALDALRRQLCALPLDEQTDFEKTVR
jgi:nicotinamide-nucleotide amidase